ncbi:MAG: Veg family protein [Lachnospirales bacterium]
MYTLEYIETLRNDINKQVGKEVKIARIRGRKKKEIVEGTLYNTYPNIFTVAIKNGDTTFLSSYSYVDVVTKVIKLNFS